MRNENRDAVRQDLPSDGRGAVEALLTGGDPRRLRNVGIVIGVASRQPERLAELVQCVFSADEIVRMRASDALEKVCRPHPPGPAQLSGRGWSNGCTATSTVSTSRSRHERASC